MYFADGVPPVGISRHTGATGYPFFFFGDLHTYSCGKYWNDPFNQDWFPTSHTHVLLPGNLSFVGVCYSSTITPKMLADIFIGEENHFLCWLLSADVLLYSLGHKRMHPFWVNGPWPLCGRMQPSPLRPDRVQDCLPESGSRGFYSRPGELCGSHRLCEQLVIVQFRWHPSLLLWHPPTFKLSCSDTHLYESILSTFAGVNIVGSLLVILTSYCSILFSIFRMHPREGICNAFSMGHLIWHLICHLNRHPVLLHLHLHLSQTYFQLLPDSGQSSFCVLHSGHPHVESSDLQSSEQGSEESFMEYNY